MHSLGNDDIFKEIIFFFFLSNPIVILGLTSVFNFICETVTLVLNFTLNVREKVSLVAITTYYYYTYWCFEELPIEMQGNSPENICGGVQL